MFTITDVLLLCTTIIYAAFTFFIAKDTRGTLKEAKVARQLAYRPEVIAFFYEENGMLYFQIKNIGTRIALNTTVEINPVFNSGTSVLLKDTNFMQWKDKTFQKDIKVLAPDQKLETFVQVYHEITAHYEENIKKNPEEKDILDSTIYLTYYDYEGTKHKENYGISLLDYEHRKGEIKLGLNEGVKSLQSIDNKLNSISKQIEKKG